MLISVYYCHGNMAATGFITHTAVGLYRLDALRVRGQVIYRHQWGCTAQRHYMLLYITRAAQPTGSLTCFTFNSRLSYGESRKAS